MGLGPQSLLAYFRAVQLSPSLGGVLLPSCLCTAQTHTHTYTETHSLPSAPSFFPSDAGWVWEGVMVS